MADKLDPDPWRRLPRELADALRADLTAQADELLEELRRSVPEYARPLQGEFGRGIRRGVQEALAGFVELLGRSAPMSEERARLYRALGRGELRAGRSLDALQSAYRVGARVAWRRASVAAGEAGASPEDQRLLAESIFAYIDQIAALSVAGYAAAQAEREGERQRRRRALAQLLLAETPPAAADLDAAARAAAWSVPRTLAVLVAEGIEPPALARRIDPDAVGVRGDERAAVIVPDPDGPGRAALVAGAVEGVERAALGPTVAPAGTAESLRLAVRALALGENGLVRADDRLAELVLTADPATAKRLAGRALAPFQALTPAVRSRLEETLLALLLHQGNRQRAAEALHVHPQTVRYRERQLRTHLGGALEDPERRFELLLALRARCSAGGSPSPGAASAA